MTFYWWSHWFWITVFMNILFIITSVYTYPNPEITLEYNQNVKTTPNTITKLYQTTTLKWPASTTTIQSEPPFMMHSTTSDTPLNSKYSTTSDTPINSKYSTTPNTMSITTILPSDQMTSQKQNINDDDSKKKKISPKILINDEVDRVFEELPLLVDIEDADNDGNNQEDTEFKRSAEEFTNKNKTEVEMKQKLMTLPADDDGVMNVNKTEKKSVLLASVKLKQDEIIEHNNFTNFTSKANIIESNTSNIILTKNASTIASTTSASLIANKTAGVNDGVNDAAEWFNMTKSLNETNIPKNAKIDNVKMDRNQNLSTPSSDNVGDGSAIAAVTAVYQRVAAAAAAPVAPPPPPSFTLDNINKDDELHRAESEHRSRKSKVLSAEYRFNNRDINFSSETKNILTRSAASTAPNDFDISNIGSGGSASGVGSNGGGSGTDDGNISSEALAIKRTYFLDAGAISAICFTVFGVCCTIGTIGIVLYRRKYSNKPQALSEPDSSVYIDDSTMRVSDNSDEMYSLDNDSFLNSLEAMTIQNYWTDTVKHTKL